MRKGRSVHKAYLAGFIDGEGCFTYVTRKNTNCASIYIKITNTNYDLLIACQRMMAELGIKAGVYKHWKKKPKNHWKDQWFLQTTNVIDCLKLSKILKPFLIAKKQHCELAIEFYKSRINVQHKAPKNRKMTKRELQIGQIIHKLNERGVKIA